MEHVTTLKDVSWEEVKAALLNLRGQDLHNYLENEDAQVNSAQGKKMLSDAAIQKSKQNGFSVGNHKAAVSAVEKLWGWACKTGVKGSKNHPEKVDRYVASLQTADGADAFAWFTVKDTAEGLRLYSVELMDQEKLRSNLKANSADALRPAHLSFDQIISRLRGESNGTEKIILEQASGLANGSITKREDATYVIDLFQRANLSTLPHELGHVYFLEFERLHREGLMDADLQDDYKKLCDFVGAKVGDTLTTEQHEKLARAWESYLMEGKSPAPEMRGTFARFRDWMIRIYQSLKNLNVELSDEVRGVFDRMIATREEIEETAAEHEVINLTSDQMDAMGMPRSQQEYNRAVLAEAKKMAAERLQERRDLENFRAACRQSGDAEATVQKYEERIRAALSWCASEGLIPANPWARFHGLRGIQHKTRDGDPEDFARIYSVLPPALQWACRTCIALCLRPGDAELGALKWESIDLAHGLARVYMSKVRRTKTVYPPSWWLEEAKLRRGEDDDYVCRSPRGKRLSTLVLWSHWLKACRAVGVHMPPYAMRHLAASAMLEAGADPISVAAQLGHSNVTTTVKFYAHVRAKKQIEAAKALAAPNVVHLVRLVRETDTKEQ